VIKLSVSIDVSNLKEAENFYIEALGCKKLRDQGDMSVIAVDNCDIYLQEKEAGSKPIPSGFDEIERQYSRHWTPVHLDFLAENVDEIVEKVLKLGGKHEGGESGEWGSIAYCVDPFGNGFDIINE
jgi:predicted enzyme related to lactoylglutathione lyase